MLQDFYADRVDYPVYRYVGPHKISAIKAVRYVLGVDLKEGKEMVEHPGGLRIHPLAWKAIFAEYQKQPHGEPTLGDILGHALNKRMDHWQEVIYVPPLNIHL